MRDPFRIGFFSTGTVVFGIVILMLFGMLRGHIPQYGAPRSSIIELMIISGVTIVLSIIGLVVEIGGKEHP